MKTLSWRRLKALCIKETHQILRDPSTALIAFFLPLLLLVIFGYGINLDTENIPLGVCNEDQSADADAFLASLQGSSYFTLHHAPRPELDQRLKHGEIRAFIVIPQGFARRLHSPQDTAPIQVISDGTEPNTAQFVNVFLQGVWQKWRQNRARDTGEALYESMDVRLRYWFNPAAISRHYLIPGSISIIMTVVGAMLTSLVIAREWERGTMEALLASPASSVEILLSKLLPYYTLGILSMIVVVVSATQFMDIPFRGSFVVLFLVTSFFLLSMLGIGLFISSTMRNQFDSAQTSLNVAFLPAVMLSGAFFVIASMPLPVRLVTYLLPARYFVSSLQTLFLAGNIWDILLPDMAFLSGTSLLFLGLTFWKTKRRLDA